MKFAIAVNRPFHAAQMANVLAARGAGVSILSSAPRRYFGALDRSVATRLVPAPVQILEKLARVRVPQRVRELELALFDRAVAAALPEVDVVAGFATQSLRTGLRAKRLGAGYVLDRACPHCDFQQAIVREEAAKVGARYVPQAGWLRERQLREYAEADVILVPSAYSAGSFSAELQTKIVVAPLLGRLGCAAAVKPERDGVFTVGVLGGNPLRKGFLYVLEAWKALALPNARLLIRNAGLERFPRLAQLLRELPNVEPVGYVRNIAEFYARCDVFCLPSVDDGFGMALCEAMAHGVASIATTHCGASEQMTDGMDGLVVPAGDSEALAAAIERLYRDAGLRAALGEAGRATMERVAAQDVYGKRVWDAFRRATASR